MGMYDRAQQSLGRGTEHREDKGPKGPQSGKGSSGVEEEPGKADGNEGIGVIHRRLAGHHAARAEYHEKLADTHKGEAGRHREEAAFHEGAAGEH